MSQITEEFLKKAETQNPEINAFYKITDEIAKKTAKELDEKLVKIKDKMDFPILFNFLLQEHPLFGIPFATKAIIQLEGEVFNASSKIMDGFVAPFSATVMEKILAAGAVLIGVNNMDQWAMGSSGETCDYGNIKNPFDLERTPGGSSAGAAASVASPRRSPIARPSW